MGTQPCLRPPVTAALLLVVMCAACGGGANSTAGHSPASSTGGQPSPKADATSSGNPSPSAAPVSVPYGVLVGNQAGSTYSVSLVATSGRIAATAEVSTPAAVSCGTTAGAVVPLPVSTSDSRAYFLDAQGAVHFLSPDGATGKSTTVPAATPLRRSMFAVSPDDQRIAVVVADYSATQASTRLYVEDLNGGGHRVDIFSESGTRSLWPVGWRGSTSLVLAVVPSCTQGGGPFCCGMQELHVVDPATGARRFTLGSTATCVIAGAPSPAGALCEKRDFTQATVLNWTAGTVRTLTLSGPAFAYLSPGGGTVAMVDQTGTSFTIGASAIPGMFACTWLDDQHVMSGGDPQHQPRIADVATGDLTPVPAQGDCGGRIPGGL